MKSQYLIFLILAALIFSIFKNRTESWKDFSELQSLNCKIWVPAVMTSWIPFWSYEQLFRKEEGGVNFYNNKTNSFISSTDSEGLYFHYENSLLFVLGDHSVSLVTQKPTAEAAKSATLSLGSMVKLLRDFTTRGWILTKRHNGKWNLDRIGNGSILNCREDEDCKFKSFGEEQSKSLEGNSDLLKMLNSKEYFSSDQRQRIQAICDYITRDENINAYNDEKAYVEEKCQTPVPLPTFQSLSGLCGIIHNQFLPLFRKYEEFGASQPSQ